MNQNIELGQNGEEIAGDYLSKKGYRILHRNWNLHRGCELDIVAMKNNELHFVEVKTRRKADEFTGRPEEAVNKRKLINIQRAIAYYISYYHLTNEMHIDVIGIVYKNEQEYEINFLPDVSFYEMKYQYRNYKNYRH